MDDAIDQQPRHRYLSERLVVTGDLVLTRPAHFGNGDEDDLTDLPLLLNEVDDRALITGASLAGALRNYLRERQCGYEFPMSTRDPLRQHYKEWTETENDLLAASLFGGHRGDPDGEQSPLIVDDALSRGDGLPLIEHRDGVAINTKTRTAEDKKKYDYELLAAGTQFELRFELLLEDESQRNPKCERAKDANSERVQALALALQALAHGDIRLGARKRRGFGCCEVKQWTVKRYRLNEPNELLAWMAADHEDWLVQAAPDSKTSSSISTLLQEAANSLTVKPNPNARKARDYREWFEINARFAVDGSLMVRSGFEDLGELEEQPEEGPKRSQEKSAKRLNRRPDFVHLRTRAQATDNHQPILPGTSLAGALRQRAERIANTLADEAVANQLIGGMFGPRKITGGSNLRASRITVNEEFVEKGRALVQTRIKLDRFTGGTLETALLEEEPIFGGEVNMGMRLQLIPNKTADAEIGLLLLVLKDLWLGDLPLGGEAAIGRGRLRGQTATLRLQRLDQPLTEIILHAGPDGRFEVVHEAALLEQHVHALKNWAEGKTE